MPLRRHARKGRKHVRVHRAHRVHHKSHVKHVKELDGLFPKTCHSKAVLSTDFTGNNVVGPCVLSFPLNGLYRPMFLWTVAGGAGTIQDCAPYLYLDAGSVGTGILGSRGTGAAYSQYKVLGCKFKFEIINNSANALKIRGYLNIPTTNVGAVAPTFSSGTNFAENQRCHVDLLIPANTAQSKPTIFSKYISAKTMFQMTHAQIAADSGESPSDSICVRPAGVGTANYATENPPILSWWLMRATGLNGSDLAVNDIFVRVRFEWWLELFGKNLIFEAYAPQLEEKKDDPEEPEDPDPPVLIPPSAAAPPNPQKNTPPPGGAAGLATKGPRTAGPTRRP